MIFGNALLAPQVQANTVVTDVSKLESQVLMGSRLKSGLVRLSEDISTPPSPWTFLEYPAVV